MDKNASEIIDILYKFAKEKEYLDDIVCEQCDYEGKPETDGRCPKCGAMCGVMPTDHASDQRTDAPARTSTSEGSYDVTNHSLDGSGDMNFY